MAPGAPLQKLPLIDPMESTDPFLGFGWPDKSDGSSPDNRGSLASINPGSSWFPDISTQGFDMDLEMIIQTFPYDNNFPTLDVTAFTEEIILGGPNFNNAASQDQRSATDFILTDNHEYENAFPNLPSVDYELSMEPVFYPYGAEELIVGSFSEPVKPIFSASNVTGDDLEFWTSFGVFASSAAENPQELPLGSSSDQVEHFQYKNESMPSPLEVEQMPYYSSPEPVITQKARSTKSKPPKKATKPARKAPARRQSSYKSRVNPKKKEQNRTAALRYRDKKRQAENTVAGAHESLLRERDEMLKSKQDLMNEIKHYLHLAEKKAGKMRR